MNSLTEEELATTYTSDAYEKVLNLLRAMAGVHDVTGNSEAALALREAAGNVARLKEGLHP